jgi:hypothetical protein
VLLSEFLRAVAPAARGNAGSDPAVNARRVYGDRRAETLANHPDSRRVDFGARRKERERIPRVLDLLLADDAAALAFAFTASAEIEPQRRVS